ncbi:MAG: prepilin-type N-terminal cleavage/methylation domain-containing protein, partial [Candidatus Omnitrophica bacterium]|nr:prepilin-type N-terminal cleavage/methylation domain-containing protein [Candidatus Omnitrophota bacterium]
MKNQSRRGFTLMEMMMTALIAGILAAVALPGYVRTKERSYWQEAE